MIKSANAAESLPDETGDDDNSSDENGSKNNSQKTQEQLLNEHKLENQRKSKKIADLEREVKVSKDRISELEEKEEENGVLSQREQEELDELQGDVKKAAKLLRAQKSTGPWITIAQEEAETVAENKAVQVLMNSQIEASDEFIEDRAEEQTELDLETGEQVTVEMTPEELADKIKPFMTKYANKMPRRQTELAYRDYVRNKQRLEAIDKKEHSYKKKDEEEQRFKETGSRTPRNSNKEKEFDKANTKDKVSSVIDLMDENPGYEK